MEHAQTGAGSPSTTDKIPRHYLNNDRVEDSRSRCLVFRGSNLAASFISNATTLFLVRLRVIGGKRVEGRPPQLR